MEKPIHRTNFSSLARTYWPMVLLGLVTLVVLIRTAWVCDDAFISFTSSANLAEGKGFTFQPGERLQTFSNPLWTLLIAGAYAITGEVWRPGMVLGILFSLTAVFLLMRAAKGEKLKLLMMGSLVLLSSAFIDYSTSGLENPLSHVLILLFAGQFFRDRKDAKWLRNLIFLAALLMLNRPDMLFLAGPASIYAIWVAEKGKRWKSVLIGLLPILLWELFSLTYYGFLLPNTWYAKLGMADGRWLLMGKGLVYFWNCLREDPVTNFVIVAAGVSVILGKDRKAQALMLGVGFYVLAVISAGGDFMQGRMFTVPFVLSLFILLHSPLPKKWPIGVGLVIFIGLFRLDCPLYSGVNYHVGRTEYPEEYFPDMITDERAMYWQKTGWFANHGQLQHPMLELERKAKRNRAGEAWKMPIKETKIMGAVGMRGYEAIPGIRIIDNLALADGLLARLPAIETRWWRAGHRPRMIPYGYEAHLIDSSKPLIDPKLNEYLRQLDLVTRGPIWSAERWGAIWRFATGQNKHLIDQKRYRDAYVEVKANEKPPFLDGNIEVNGFQSILISFSNPQHPIRLEFDAISGGELWVELQRNGNSIQAQKVKNSHLEKIYDHFEVEIPRSTGVSGFDQLLLRGESYTSNLNLLKVELVFEE